MNVLTCLPAGRCVCGSDGTRIFMMIMIKYEELEHWSNRRIACKLSE